MLFAAVLTAIGLLGLGPLSNAASAADGLNIDAHYTYRFDEAGVLSVEAVFDLGNVTPSRTRRYTVTSYYFDSYSVALADDAENVNVTDGQDDLTFELVIETHEATDEYEVRKMNP